MTPTEIRIAVAEECGRNGWWCPQCKKLVDEHSLGYQCRHANCTESAQQAPNYPFDLNAVHEVEKLLSQHPDKEHSKYLIELEKVLVRDNKVKGLKLFVSRADFLFVVVRATALQRCEAFLRVKGRWEE